MSTSEIATAVKARLAALATEGWRPTAVHDRTRWVRTGFLIETAEVVLSVERSIVALTDAEGHDGAFVSFDLSRGPEGCIRSCSDSAADRLVAAGFARPDTY
jgi:hypothetical protein